MNLLKSKDFDFFLGIPTYGALIWGLSENQEIVERILGVNFRYRYQVTPFCANSMSVSSFDSEDHSSRTGGDKKRAPAVISY